MRTSAVVATLAITSFALGCTASPHSQEEVRHDAAAATATVASDLKGAALGIRDGLKSTVTHDPAKAAVNINSATRPTLETLPGITPALASQIVAHRPYRDSIELRKRHIVTPEEYDRISARLTTSD